MLLCYFVVLCLCYLLFVIFLLLVGSFSVYVVEEMLCKVVGKGVYEMVYSQQENVLWVVILQSCLLDKGGVVYCFDFIIFDVMQIIYNDLKLFGVIINYVIGMLWFGNIVDSIVIVIDVKIGVVKGCLVLDECQCSEIVCLLQLCELVVNEQINMVYIIGLGKESVIWVVDGVILKLKMIIIGIGVMVMGLVIDLQVKCLYIINVDGELLIIDSESNMIVLCKKLQDDGKVYFYFNLSFDIVGYCVFIIDSKQLEVLVVDICDGKVLEKIVVLELLVVLFNFVCNEVYVMYCKVGEVSVIDGKSYKVVKIFKMLIYFNSLVFFEDGKMLYVSVK